MCPPPSPVGARARRLLALALAAAATPLLPAPPAAHADSRYWVATLLNGNSSWSNPTNWSTTSGGPGGASVPGPADTAFINYNDPLGTSIPNPVLDQNASLFSLNIGSGGSGTPSLTQNANFSLSTTSAQTIASQINGRGAYNQSAGTNTVGAALYVGYATNSRGFYNLSGTGSLLLPASAGAIYVGYAGAGTFNHSGGSVTIGAGTFLTPLFVGYSPGSNGTYSLSGTATLVTTASEYVGYDNLGTGSATGSFSQTGGTNNTGSVIIATNAGATGSYSLSAGRLAASSAEYVGYGDGAGPAYATFTQSGGSNTAQDVIMGYHAGTTGSFSLSGGTLAVTDTEYVGYTASPTLATSATFAHSAGTNSTPTLSIAYGQYTTGTYSLSGTALLNVTGAESLGDEGTASLTQSGGTHTTPTLALGGHGGTGTYSLSAGSLTTSTAESFYTGTFTQSGGTHTVGSGNPDYSNAPLGLYSRDATYLLNGPATLNVRGSEILNGTFTQTDGSHTVASPSAPAQLALFGGSNDIARYNLSGTGSLTVNGSLYVGGASIAPAGFAALDIAGGSLTVTDALHVYDYFSTSATLSAGSLTVASLVDPGYHFSWTGGNLTVTGPQGLTIGTGGLLPAVSLSPSKNLSASSLTLSPSGSLTLNNGGSLSYSNSLLLAGGTLTVNTPFTNSSLISGTGTIAGNGAFSNAGSLSIPSGTLTLSDTGPLSSSGLLSLAPGAQLSLTGSPLTNTGTITLSPGSRIAGPAPLNNNSPGVIQGAGTISSPLTNAASASILVSTGTLALAQPLTNAGTITLTGPASTLKLTTPLTNPGTIDLATGTLLLSPAGPATDQSTRQDLLSHHLFSSSSDSTHRPGYLDTGATLTVHLTLTGDANLDGVINADDYALLDRSFAQHPTSAFWWQGDFNYDGQVTTGDYLLIDTAYYHQLQGFSPDFLAKRESEFGPAYVSALLTSIPEPSSLLAACGLALPPLARRRRAPLRTTG